MPTLITQKWMPFATSVVDANPFIVAPDTPVSQVLNHLSNPSEDQPSKQQSPSCALIVDAGKLLGIFTTRDALVLIGTLPLPPIISSQNISPGPSDGSSDEMPDTISGVMNPAPVTLERSQCRDLATPLWVMRQAHIRHLPIIETTRELVGLITPTTLYQAIRETKALHLATVGQVMAKQVVWAEPTVTVAAIATQMLQHQVSYVVIAARQDQRLHPLGVITEREILTLHQCGWPLDQTAADQVMGATPAMTRVDEKLWRIQQQMQNRQIQEMMVVEQTPAGPHLHGILTQSHLLRVFDHLETHSLNDALRAQVHHLEVEKMDLLRQRNQELEQQMQQQAHLYSQLQIELRDRLQAEAHLHKALAEKEILLKEIHHRVKNNLNVIASLLNLQSSYVDDEAAMAMFVNSQHRIRTMALIHEQLYGSDDLARIDFGRYIQDLARNILAAHPAEQVCIETDITPVKFNIETAIPCGLLINELVTNALKYAFPPETCGQIDITLAMEGEDYVLKICDRGVGMPPELDWENSVTLGLRLVRLLSLQLEGHLEKLSTPLGTTFQLRFRELAYADRL